jgi:hypothetical protein
MLLRSGTEFLPYFLKDASQCLAAILDAVSTSISVEPLIQAAVAQEDEHFEQGADDSEGLGVCARPPSPLTESDSEDFHEVQAPDHPPHLGPSPGPHSFEKKRRSAGAKQRRATKRVKLASSGHRPHAYATNPATVAHHAEDLEPLRVPVDAENFPASGSGAWVGKRKSGTKKTPWTVPELIEENFTIIEWDGR